MELRIKEQNTREQIGHKTKPTGFWALVEYVCIHYRFVLFCGNVNNIIYFKDLCAMR